MVREQVMKGSLNAFQVSLIELPPNIAGRDSGKKKRYANSPRDIFHTFVTPQVFQNTFRAIFKLCNREYVSSFQMVLETRVNVDIIDVGLDTDKIASDLLVHGGIKTHRRDTSPVAVKEVSHENTTSGFLI